MGKVYFVRHGQTYWNVENKICGATDIALTPLGHEQAIETGKAILDAGIEFDEILSSPLIRASETARHISEITGKPSGSMNPLPGMALSLPLQRNTLLTGMKAVSQCCIWHSASTTCWMS